MAAAAADPEKPPITTAGPPSTPGKPSSIHSKAGSTAVSVEVDPLAHLPTAHAVIIRRQLAIPEHPVSFFALFRYSTVNDNILHVIGALCAIIGGAILPIMTILFGTLAQSFQNFMLGIDAGSKLQHDINRNTLYFVYLAIGEFVTIYASTVIWLYTGEHIAQKIRENYLKAILRQNIGFFDKLGAGEITTRITADTNLIQEGISEKIGLTLTALATFLSAFVVGFIRDWKLTLILSSTIVAIVLASGTGFSFVVKFNRTALNSYAEGGTIAEEVLASARNATAFNSQDRLAKKYDEYLKVAEYWGTRMKSVMGTMIGFMMTIVFLTYGLAFWQGSRFLVNGQDDLGQIITVMMAIMIGAFSLGGIAPNAQNFSTAVAAGTKIYNTIDRVSPLDPDVDTGDKLDAVEGTIELKNVVHIYPSRPEVTVLHNMNLTIPAGKTTALVGASGSGKSTIVGLVERFYEPVEGEVLLDGHDMSKLNLRWLREHVSLVQQEPVLFGTTIYGNVCHGLIGTKYENESEEVKRELVRKACVISNADGFITSLPEGYETNVGERGFLMSGGQKQRIAIARAVVSDPKILLLDEATSALDSRSEGVVQAALDEAAKGRTTIAIAHRLSTIKGADNIVVMQEGRIVEQGRHDDLIESRGAYFQLVEAQRISSEKEKAAAFETDDSETTDDDEKLRIQLSRSHGSTEDLALKKTTTTRSQHDVEKGVPEDPDDKIRLARTQTGKSLSSLALADRPKEKDEHYSLWTLIKMTASFNKPEMKFMIPGLFCSVIAGGGNPTQAVLFAHAILALTKPKSEYDQLRKDANFWAGMFLMLALIEFLAFMGQGILFAICSERLIHRVRDRAFRTMMRQDISFFDREENTTGALTSFLSTETTHLAGMSGPTLGTILNVSTTLCAAIVVSLSIGWKLALVCIATMPILLSCGFLRFYMLARFQTKSKKAYGGSASYACEATAAIRTVASLTREKDVFNNYHDMLEAQAKKSLVSNLKNSTLYAASQSLMFLCMALGFWYGGTLIRNGEYDILKFFTVFTSVIFGAQSAGTVFSFAPDMGKAHHAATQIKTLFDRKPEIDSWSEQGDQVPSLEGSIEFRDVHFRYPTRPDQPVLRGLNLTVKPGQYIALVGPSGCGKSTSIALIERFYNVLSGGVYVDGKNIESLNINQYRSWLALVSQEPTLYQGSIRENIMLGSEEEVGMDMVEEACRQANILDFVKSLPEGFDTVCGSKGALLSGGQKQRIAIARALIRNPRILLLDEATAALDSESEQVVQAALDAAAQGRTTIAVAHRLSTVRKADCIYVFDAGRIVESGTHEELLGLKGKYFELVKLQSLDKTG